MKSLVIVESPTKARTIGKFLGSDYVIKASMGHVMDLPKSKIGIDFEHNFKPLYEMVADKEEIIAELKTEAKKADQIILATDPDREGEAIASHISDMLRSNEKLKVKNEKFLSRETSDLIKEGMVESCAAGGVAWPLFNFKIKNQKSNLKDEEEIKIACKTGTAQHGGEETLPHAWITLFAPAEKPEIIVTVLSEASGEGSNVAAPIAKKILEEWFSR